MTDIQNLKEWLLEKGGHSIQLILKKDKLIKNETINRLLKLDSVQKLLMGGSNNSIF